MKKLYATLAVICIAFIAHAQCSLQVSCMPVSCPATCDGSATAFANGVPPFSYLWMPGGQTTQMIAGLCTGTYTCVVTDSLGCNATAQCSVTAPAPLQVSISNVTNPSCSSCCDGSATGNATGGIPPYTAFWSPPPTPMWQYNGMCVGTYTFCVTDANGCTACDTLTASFSSGVSSPETGTQLTLVNSGAPGVFHLSADFTAPTSSQLVVTNIVGQIVYTESISSTQHFDRDMDFTVYGSGLYFVSVVTDNGTVTRRIVCD